MFWACEEKLTQFWCDDLLVDIVFELLIGMMKCVKSKFCMNYFIPGNNMMDHLIDTDLSYEIDSLSIISQTRELISNVIDTCRLYELIAANRIYLVELPAWIKRAYVIYYRLNNPYDNYQDLFCTDLTTDLQKALYVELSDIYRGLLFQQKSVGCVKVSDKQMHFLKSESHLLLAINLCKSSERDMIENCSVRFIECMISEYMPYDTNVTDESRGSINYHVELDNKRGSIAVIQNSLNARNEQKCLLYCRFVIGDESKYFSNFLSEKVREVRKVNFAVYNATEINASNKIDVKFFKEWPGHSPTVNISWFIAKAYLANLYYRTQHDVSLAIQTCDDIIDVYRQSQKNQFFSERAFAVVLSTQWTIIYDKEIQELLGFYSLCSYVLDKCSSRSVYLGVCPVQFALYLKVRMTMKLLIDWTICDYDEHFRVCTQNTKVTSGIMAMTQIFNILGFNAKHVAL